MNSSLKLLMRIAICSYSLSNTISIHSQLIAKDFLGSLLGDDQILRLHVSSTLGATSEDFTKLQNINAQSSRRHSGSSGSMFSMIWPTRSNSVGWRNSSSLTCSQMSPSRSSTVLITAILQFPGGSSRIRTCSLCRLSPSLRSVSSNESPSAVTVTAPIGDADPICVSPHFSESAEGVELATWRSDRGCRNSLTSPICSRSRTNRRICAPSFCTRATSARLNRYPTHKLPFHTSICAISARYHAVARDSTSQNRRRSSRLSMSSCSRSRIHSWSVENAL
ncbi:uncharacterized protein [Blastocystis hominis]|uniref:Uncharacterized protein n=1 Tax=Blastocystis hominis TaxID=12968 RepID=D8LZF8_BLAHO|nr:uncharacterized protein [Blastocystis hominis]CBK21197.2 unnamed protein product [Blastocystis hominis]|eukprot:XP_012895245.1 uncharacterized protein [Blastocystis hominis]